MAEKLRLGERAKRLDLEVMEHGIRKECPWAPGVYFTVLPWGTQNKKYKRALQVRAMKMRSQQNGKRETKELDEGELEDFVFARQEDPEFIVDAVLADVEGLLNGKTGKALKYTRERGIQILSDPGWAHVKDWIVGIAMQAANAYEEDVEAEAKN